MKQYVLRRSIRIHYGVMEIMTLAIFGNVWRRDLAVWLLLLCRGNFWN